MNVTRPAALTAAALLALTAAGCGSTTPAAAPPPSTAPASPSPAAAPTDVPSTSECAQFADVYNQTVVPAIKSADGGDLAWTKQADAFAALLKILDPAPDPYSQTLDHDATALVASDRAYDADASGYGLLVTFNTDLQGFLKQCGYSGNS